MQINRGKIVITLMLMSLSIGMLVYSFAFTTINNVGESTNYLKVSEILFNFKDSVEGISLNNQVPSIDKFGLLNEPFTFSISNDSDKEESYTVRLIDNNIVSTIKNNNVRYQLIINGVASEPKTLIDSGIIDSGLIQGKSELNYSLRVWLSENTETINGIWNKVVKIEAGVVNIDNSGANEPRITDGMIPVYYDNTYNLWRKADITNSNINYMWYDYDSKIWANAVTVDASNRQNYLDSVPGTEIKMTDINSMWVWIPRFNYVVFNSKGDDIKPINIKINFERGNKTTGTVVCNNLECFDKNLENITSGKSTYTHPAFTFNDEELTGIWVSKFGASPAINTTCYEEVNKINCNHDHLNINIKPNLKLLTDVNISNLFKNFRRMELSNNIYGFKSSGTSVNNDGTIIDDDNDIDIHMIKNSEWNAVTYLYHSKYGKYNDSDYTNKEVYMNPGKISGTSYGDSVSTNRVYNYDINKLGTGASTTGNIYGIYDLNSAIEEVVMANLVDDNDEFMTTSKKEFTSPYPKNIYYDAYIKNNFNKKIYSGTYETRKWYDDSYNTGNSYFITRGNNTTNETNGLFNINVGVDINNKWISRPTMKITDNIYITKW